MPKGRSGRTFEYHLRGTIKELDGWLNRGESFFPIETVISAVHWLEKARTPMGAFPLSFEDTLAELRSWLANEDPELPVPTGEATLYWLRQVQREDDNA